MSAPPDMCVYHAQFGFGDPVTDVILKYIANGTISLKGPHSVAIITHDHTSLQRHHWRSFNMGKVLFITGKPTNIDYL